MAKTSTRKAKRAPKPKRAKLPHGRPTDYCPEYDDKAYKLCLLGATNAQIAEIFGVTESTLDNWKERHPGFLGAITRGKQAADAAVAEALYHRALGYSHPAVKIFMPANASEPVYADYTEHYPPDTQAASLWLRNRQPKLWRDKVEHEHTGKDGGPIEQITREMTAEEAAQIYRERITG